MKKLLVFVNFMEASERALDQAIALARLHKASLVISHIVGPENDEEEVREKLRPMMQKVEATGLDAELRLEYGDLFEAAAQVARSVKPDLVVAGTRGIEGFDMRLHGSAIYKFVRDVGYTSLILHPDSPIAENGYLKVMLPVSPHTNFIKKVTETVKVLGEDGEVIVFSLTRKGEKLEEDLVQKQKEAESYLNDSGIKWKELTSETNKVGHAFASETLERFKDEKMDLITIATDLSQKNRHFGKMHKEDVLLNRSGIPVLCVNTDFE
jgi:Mn-dependent DtxR family transcriptional regulator/nucleotide-binding universal stress UspA family protein